MSSKKFEISVQEVISYHGNVVADSKEDAIRMVIESWATKQLTEADHDLSIEVAERAIGYVALVGGDAR